ncbi:MAG: hypothetical protein ACJ8LG_06385 [Massilia sp.]
MVCSPTSGPQVTGLQLDKRQQCLLLDTLERLHDAALACCDVRMLELARQAVERAAALRDGLQRAIANAETCEHRALNLSSRLADGLLEMRMCPFGEGVHALPRMVRDLARSLSKDVRPSVEGEAPRARDRRQPSHPTEPPERPAAGGGSGGFERRGRGAAGAQSAAASDLADLFRRCRCFVGQFQLQRQVEQRVTLAVSVLPQHAGVPATAFG